MSKFTYARGEYIKFEGSATLKAGLPIYLKNEDLSFIENMSEGYTKIFVSMDGVWQTNKLRIKENASLGTYVVNIYLTTGDIPNQSNVLDTNLVKIEIVKQELNASLDKKYVPRGGKLTITGTTTVSKIYIFASESDVFEGVTEIPSYATTYTIGPEDLGVQVVNGKFSKTLGVLIETTDPGYYLLYVFAPSNPNVIEMTKDSQKILPILVTDAYFANIPDNISMVRGQGTNVKIRVTEESKDDLYVNFTFKGEGIKITPKEYNLFNKRIPDFEGKIELNLYPFWYRHRNGNIIDVLEAEYNTSDMSNSSLLATGVYSLEAELFYRDTGEDIEKVIIPVKVLAPELDAEVPAEVALGDKVKITVKTNREENYDGIYVVIGRAINPVWEKVKTDENGVAVAEFATAGLGLGSYSIYVRDTLGTIDPEYDIVDFYDWNPAIEEEDWLKDDVLVVKKVDIVREVTTKPFLKISGGRTSPNYISKVNVMAINVADVANFDITVTYNPAIVTVTNVSINPSFGTAICNLENASEGWIRVSSLNMGKGLSGDVMLLVLSLKALGDEGETSHLNLIANSLLNSSEKDIPIIVQNSTFVIGLHGDINGDDDVSLSDAIYLAKLVLGLSEYTEAYAQPDINCDGKVDLKDAIYLAKHVVGISGYEELYPCK